MADVRLSLQAQADLDEIWDFSRGEFGPDAADTYLRGFNDSFALLRRYPHSGAVVIGLRQSTRSLVHRRHRIFYVIEEDVVRIVRILHVAQNAAQTLN